MNILLLHILLFNIFSIIFLVLIRTPQSKKIFIILITIQCIILVGLRDSSIGVDTLRYEAHFYRTLSDISYIFTQEDIGFFLLQKIVGTILWSDFNFWLLFISIIIYVPLGIIIYKHSNHIYLSYLLYFSWDFFFFNFTGIRQSLAITGILISYIFINNKNPWKFIVTVLISATMHSSALVFLPAYWFARKKITKLYLIILSLVITVIYILRNQVGELLTFLYYEDAELILSIYEASSGLGGISIFIILILFLGLIFYDSKNSSDDEGIKILTNIMIIALMIQIISGFSYLFTRLNMYYFIFVILYLPNTIKNIGLGDIKMNSKDRSLVKITVSIIFIGFFIGYYLYKVSEGMDRVLPYKFYWN
ncbi:EpsG family protein [Jeotgalibacillus sp. ET6]|uniref:EpsG family protein n=1 Tax=Jeotgalibacillus sp. ET6 TaxID=3037260 RepID=UPI0024186ED8|nr:EpsG family protein [Jeotgalibacillus sp. ET6]MDG5471366.1 EpsG family protein [Jeotgalibacillus sp. ET6]